MPQPLISVVIPVYGCAQCLPELKSRLYAALEQISEHFEIILVNDASPDDSWEAIQRLAVEDPRTKGISLSRNFGQHYAITAGLDHARGEWVVVMDCDLQHPPAAIPRLVAKWEEGYKVVYARRAAQKNSLFKRLTSRLYYQVIDSTTDVAMPRGVGDFRLIDQTVQRELIRLQYDPVALDSQRAQRFDRKDSNRVALPRSVVADLGLGRGHDPGPR